ncbi:DUF2310 family Zn-ribbon-containing protein [Paraflavitalea speifideaquila]|uniref:DUF2310 family Zn-ribbon-containing protein n=1 Tax=Paraflavitalea speifideaquila TaxID=3076558 RepID=UPI0028E40B81|nr:DUF2310 family Zn-ribbon-containing protein [Paraflavitalea speifideiaquila]
MEFYGVLIDEEAMAVGRYDRNVQLLLQVLKEKLDIKFDYVIESMIEGEVEKEISRVSGYILYQGGASPIRSLDNFFPVPLYLLPPTSTDGTNYYNFISWVNDYEAVYRLWFRGNFDDVYFLNLLSNYESSLSHHGITLCELVTRITGKNCYYYLFRYDDSDKFKGCPKCHRSWKLDEKLLGMFDYKCDHCLFIS